MKAEGGMWCNIDLGNSSTVRDQDATRSEVCCATSGYPCISHSKRVVGGDSSLSEADTALTLSIVSLTHCWSSLLSW